MSYTIKNLRDTEDSAPKFGFGDNGEAHFPKEELDAESTGLLYQVLKPGKRPMAVIQCASASGPDLAYIQYAAALKLWILGALFVGLVVPVRSGSLWLDGGAALLRWCWVDGPDGDVVGALVDRELCLGKAVRRAPDQPPLEARQGAHRGRREIVLTEVHPISIRGDRQVGVIIDDEQRLVRSSQGPQRERQTVLLQHRHRLFPKLDDGGAALERRLDDACGLDLIAPITGDQVEAHAGQSLTSFLGY